MTVTLDQPLELPCGATLKNRLGKSAMSETLGTTDNRVTAKLTRLYRAWARGGTGLSVTGNVMIDRRALGEPCNVVLEDRRDMDRRARQRRQALLHHQRRGGRGDRGIAGRGR